MTFPLLALCFLGAFYAILSVIIVRRAVKPSCRNCVYWQDCCLNAQLGGPDPAIERCVTNESTSESESRSSLAGSARGRESSAVA